MKPLVSTDDGDICSRSNEVLILLQVQVATNILKALGVEHSRQQIDRAVRWEGVNYKIEIPIEWVVG